MASFRQQWLLLLFLIVTGIWFLGSRLFRVLKILIRSVFWVIHEIWDMGEEEPAPRREVKSGKKMEPKTKNKKREIR